MKEPGQVKGGKLSKYVVSADHFQPGHMGNLQSMNRTTALAVPPLREATCCILKVGKSLEVWGGMRRTQLPGQDGFGLVEGASLEEEAAMSHYQPPLTAAEGQVY